MEAIFTRLLHPASSSAVFSLIHSKQKPAPLSPTSSRTRMCMTIRYGYTRKAKLFTYRLYTPSNQLVRVKLRPTQTHAEFSQISPSHLDLHFHLPSYPSRPKPAYPNSTIPSAPSRFVISVSISPFGEPDQANPNPLQIPDGSRSCPIEWIDLGDGRSVLERHDRDGRAARSQSTRMI